MFRTASSQTSLLEPAYALSPAKQERLARTWAPVFRAQCLPLIDEAAFAPYYCPDNGRPNVPIRVLVGLLILKDLFDFTDAAALAALDFDVRWQTALGLTSEDVAPCQKTLHTFRRLLLEHTLAGEVFATTTDRLLAGLGLHTDVQRLDSTHICSNIAQLTRLARFCTTHRLLLRRLARHCPEALARVPLAVQRRYVREDGGKTAYADAPASESRQRLAVCARDCWRLVDALRGVALPPPVAAAYALLERQLAEQCLPLEAPALPAADDPDQAEPPVPVRLRVKGEVAAGGLQSPHDPDATYGHKGVGYEVVACETVGNGEKPELITHLALGPAQSSDQVHTEPTLVALAERGLQPETLLADTTFGSTGNVLTCQAGGTTLLAPVGGASPAPASAPEIYVGALLGDVPTACALGVPAAETAVEAGPVHRWVRVTFAAAACAGCPRAALCPTVVQPDGTRVYRASVEEALTTVRRWHATTAGFHERYRWRSGIEATNSECKRAHGLGQLRVRGWARVELAMFLKGLACNCKRAVNYWVRQARQMGQPAGCAA